MRLYIDGEINRTYCQNLCLIFFPGAKFPENEEDDHSLPHAKIRVWEDGRTVVSEAFVSDGKRSGTGRALQQLGSSGSREREYKIAVGKAFIEAGSAVLGASPPWGMLVGVRPAKIAKELVRSGLSVDDAERVLRETYLLSGEKAKLLMRVNEAQKEAEALAKDGTCSLYISIPFCPTRCAYCSFVSYSTPRYLSTLPEYLKVLCGDIERVCREISERGEKLLTVYIGGGTPTVLDERQLDALLSTVRRSIGGTELLEFTVEAGRPDTVNREKMMIMLDHGVDRTSINPQILDDGILERIGRKHTTADFYRAFDDARAAGMPCINTDLIAGLPGSNSEIFKKSIDEIVSLSPENITVHTYCVKRSAELTEQAALHGDNLGIYSYFGGQSGECVDYSQKAVGDAGYLPYYLYRQRNAQGNLENVGFSKKGFEGLYNVFIMEELHNIYAVGAGAVTKIIDRNGGAIKRIFEPKYTYEYLKNKGDADK